MRIAVVGSGISSLSAAWLLSAEHQVTLFEANDYLGGHTNTVDVTLEGVTHPVDTGFLVFNDRTYPNLLQLFEILGVRAAESDMSFGVRIENLGLEWCGSDLASVFAQKRNALRPAFLGMLWDIARFNRRAGAVARQGFKVSGTLGEFLVRERYGEAFCDWYLLPMAACIWSTPADQINDFPLATFLRFFTNHGLVQIANRPTWKTVIGGGREYVRRMAAAIPDVRLNAPVASVRRFADRVEVSVSGHAAERFDALVLGCHSDQALAMLADVSAREARVLSAIRYQANVAVLHTDASFLPRAKRAWASWNYHTRHAEEGDAPVALSYLINRLQPLPFSTPVIVTLNPYRAPGPEHVLRTLRYAHPLFDEAAIAAQAELPSIQGTRRTWFCGAWTRYGFHEDGLLSGIDVARRLGASVPWAAPSTQMRGAV